MAHIFYKYPVLQEIFPNASSLESRRNGPTVLHSRVPFAYTINHEQSDDPEYLVKLIKKVIAVSVKTVELVEELAQAVAQEDWSGSAS